MIKIDGSYLEGGGQILRTAIALSTITKQSVNIYNIRKGREKPGLRPQHLQGIECVARVCDATVEGLRLNSLEVTFAPGTIQGGQFAVDTKTAGSVTLILQAVIPIGIYAPNPLELTIKGGTAVPFSPTTTYVQHVLCDILKGMGITICVDTHQHGFYPAGGGEFYARIEPTNFEAFELIERGILQKIDVEAVASVHLRESRVAERMLEGFALLFPQANAKLSYVDVPSVGCFIRSYAQYANGKLGSDCLGKRGKKAEDVGREAAVVLQQEMESGAPIDSWMVDQVIPYLAIAAMHTGKKSVVRIPRLTSHARTNIWVVAQFLPVRFEVKDNYLMCDYVT